MTKPMEFWIALCPSGKVSEVVTCDERSNTGPKMLPPCSNDDLPEWVPLIRRNEADALEAKLKLAVEALEKVKKSFEVDYYDAKAVLADLENEHKIVNEALEKIKEIKK